MNIPDLINGIFEVSGGFFLLTNIVKLMKDKKLRGVHWTPTLFFTCWGIWNLYYYPHLEQWLSFCGGLFIVTINSIWLGLLAYYSWGK